MKYLITSLTGAVLGMVASAAVLFFNPLSVPRTGPAAIRGASTYHYRFPEQSTFSLTHDGQLRLPRVPREAPRLWEAAIRATVMSGLVLEDAGGAGSIVASRVSVPLPDSELLTTGYVVADYWLLTVPGRGSIFVESDNNIWPLLRDSVVPVTYLRRSWGGPKSYAVTIGPDVRRAGTVTGISGAFDGMGGQAWERYGLQQFTAARGIEDLRGELSIDWDDDAAIQAQNVPADVE
jgi:hypothetical protein